MTSKKAGNQSGETRRSFLQTGSMAVLGMTVPARARTARMRESLAISGGAKTVAFPDNKLDALTRWPRYGPAEKKALHDLIDSNRFYEELPAFEKEWKDYTKSPFVKAHMNGSSALTSKPKECASASGITRNSTGSRYIPKPNGGTTRR